MHMYGSAVLEVRLIDEDDLKALAVGGLDPLTAEAIEAYLLHHPRAARRVDAYRRAVQRTRRAQLRVV